MELRVTLHGDPISTNSLYRNVAFRGKPRTYMSREGADRKHEYQWQYKNAVKKILWALDKKYEMELSLFFKDNRAHDIDNFSKIVLDAATGFIWNDDKQIMKLTITKALDKEFPRAEVVVHTI